MKTKIVALLLAVAIHLPAHAVPEEEVKSFSPLQISLEGLGTAFVYSLQVSVRPYQFLAVNLGASTIPSFAGTVYQVPISVSGLVFGPDHFLDIAAGLDLVFVSGTFDFLGAVTVASNGVLPQFSVGYRYWPFDGGFHFRLFMGVTTGLANAVLLPGIQLGYAF